MEPFGSLMGQSLMMKNPMRLKFEPSDSEHSIGGRAGPCVAKH